MSPLFNRGLSALVKSWLDLLIAGALLYFVDIRWFFLFCFVEWIMMSTIRHDYLRSQARIYSVASDCKLLAVMEKLGVTGKEAEVIFNKHIKEVMSEKDWQELNKDYRVVSN